MSENEMLKHFDYLFGTNVKEYIKLDMQLIKNIVDKLCDVPTAPSPTYKKNMRQQIQLSDKLSATLTDEQKILFKQYKEKRNETEVITDEQLFCFGYIFAKEFEREGTIDKE